VVNGRAYGQGFGLVRSSDRCSHYPDAAVLFEHLAHLAKP
jgi:hypothetical protein